MQVVFLIPKKGLIVRDPMTKELLPAEGTTKALIGSEGRYWRRRLKDGSVRIGEPPTVSKMKTKIERRDK